MTLQRDAESYTPHEIVAPYHHVTHSLQWVLTWDGGYIYLQAQLEGF